MRKGIDSTATASTPDNTRTHLLDVAERCFERYGINRTTMEDIATEARVSRATLYRYFGDRDSLIASISHRRAVKFASMLRSVFNKHRSLEEQLFEGLLYLGHVGQRDQFFSQLITPETIGEVNRMLLAPEAAVGFATEVWGPVLDAAEERGELRRGLQRELAYQWLTSINILIMGWIENAGGVESEHRELLREFFVPAFVNAS